MAGLRDPSDASEWTVDRPAGDALGAIAVGPDGRVLIAGTFGLLAERRELAVDRSRPVAGSV